MERMRAWYVGPVLGTRGSSGMLLTFFFFLVVLHGTGSQAECELILPIHSAIAKWAARAVRSAW